LQVTEFEIKKRSVISAPGLYAPWDKEGRMVANDIEIRRLINFETAADGTAVRLLAEDIAGRKNFHPARMLSTWSHCIQRSETEVFAKVIWGAQCRKSARWVLLGETSSRSDARSVRALARKRQITARLGKGLPLQGSSLPSCRGATYTAPGQE
jgi:hypothetical protein